MKTALKILFIGQARNFIGNKYFRYGVNVATCTVEGSQNEYEPINVSDVHAMP